MRTARTRTPLHRQPTLPAFDYAQFMPVSDDTPPPVHVYWLFRKNIFKILPKSMSTYERGRLAAKFYRAIDPQERRHLQAELDEQVENYMRKHHSIIKRFGRTGSKNQIIRVDPDWLSSIGQSSSSTGQSSSSVDSSQSASSSSGQSAFSSGQSSSSISSGPNFMPGPYFFPVNDPIFESDPALPQYLTPPLTTYSTPSPVVESPPPVPSLPVLPSPSPPASAPSPEVNYSYEGILQDIFRRGPAGFVPNPEYPELDWETWINIFGFPPLPDVGEGSSSSTSADLSTAMDPNAFDFFDLAGGSAVSGESTASSSKLLSTVGALARTLSYINVTDAVVVNGSDGKDD